MPPFVNTCVDYVHQLPRCNGDCIQGRADCRMPARCQPKPPQQPDDDTQDALGVFRGLAFVIAVDLAVLAAVLAIALAARR